MGLQLGVSEPSSNFSVVTPGWSGSEEITIYKAMGIALEDLVAAELVYRKAKAAGNWKRAIL